MKFSNPDTYTKMFNVYSGGTTLSGYTMPNHRAIFIYAGAANTTGITFQNFDGTTGNLYGNTGSTLLPVNISKIWVNQDANLKISGLL
jgi:hypothetical protein